MEYIERVFLGCFCKKQPTYIREQTDAALHRRATFFQLCLDNGYSELQVLRYMRAQKWPCRDFGRVLPVRPSWGLVYDAYHETKRRIDYYNGLRVRALRVQMAQTKQDLENGFRRRRPR